MKRFVSSWSLSLVLAAGARRRSRAWRSRRRRRSGSPDVIFVHDAAGSGQGHARDGEGRQGRHRLRPRLGRRPHRDRRREGLQRPRSTGIDIDPKRIKEANANLAAAEKDKPGISKNVRFLNQDLFATDISEATVITLYLLPSLNVKLMPKLKAELKPGTRIVSHAFDMMGQWEPERTIDVNGGRCTAGRSPKK